MISAVFSFFRSILAAFFGEADSRRSTGVGWDVWDASIHQTEGQPARMQRALSQGIQVAGPPSVFGRYRMRGSTGNIYSVTYDSCTCEDFRRRHLPCKHMYALAMQTADFDPKPFVIRTDVTAHPLRGFMNLGRFRVKGKNSKTNRVNTRTVFAVDEAAAISAVRASNPELVEPFTAVEVELPRPAPEALARAVECGQFIPEGAVAEDVEAALQRHEAYGEPTIFRWQWELATSFGIRLSALAGEQTGRAAFRSSHRRWRNEPPVK